MASTPGGMASTPGGVASTPADMASAPGGHSNSKRQNMGGHSDTGAEHIAHQSGCVFDKPMPLKKGQEMFIKCDYDFRAHSG
jgi:hypothetical protein